MLYPGNGKSLFEQLKDLLLDKISKGEYHEGDALPSERELSVTYNVSRVTVRQALQSLAAEGFIVKRQGLGNFVAYRKYENNLEQLQGFVEEFSGRNSKCEVNLIREQFVSAPAQVYNALNIHTDTEVLLVVRHIIVDGKSYGVDYTYIPDSIAPLLKCVDFSKDIIYSFLERNNYSITHADQSISAAAPSREECVILNISPSTPMLVLERTTYVIGDLPIVYNRTVYRSDRYSYKLTLHRTPRK